MRTITKTLYQFDELTDEAKQNAIEKLYDINVDFDWWKFTYADAAEIGLKLTGFDTGRGNYCKGEFINDPKWTAEKIVENHGETCETWKTAKVYLDNYNLALELEDEDEQEEALEAINDEFLAMLLEDYRIMLRNEYEYRTSEPAIIETIEANEYEFDSDGNLN